MDINDENATLASKINNQTLVPLENPRDPGSQLYHRILYIFGMTPKLMSILRRMRYFSEEQINEHINWFNHTFDGTVTRVKDIDYKKTTFGPRMSGLHKHTKLMEAESVAFNENKLIQEWVDDEIKYPYTPQDLGNRKYKQTIARTGFTENVIEELVKRGFTRPQIDKHIKIVRQAFSFNVHKSGSRRGRYTQPAKLPEIIFTKGKSGAVPITTSVTPTTSSTIEQTIGRITMADPGDDPREREHMPIISTIFSLSTQGETEDPGEQEMELEYVSTVTKDFESYDPKNKLTSQDLQIKKEMVKEDLHPGDPKYYPNLQYVYQNL